MLNPITVIHIICEALWSSDLFNHCQVVKRDPPETGIDTSIFKAHSIRSVSTSMAANAGITTKDILKAADWSAESTFHKWLNAILSYMKKVKSSISMAPTNHTPLICDMLHIHRRLTIMINNIIFSMILLIIRSITILMWFEKSQRREDYLGFLYSYLTTPITCGSAWLIP